MEACQPTLNVEKTEELVPEQESCCFCIPRRIGIIILAFIKLVMSLGMLVILYDAILTSCLFGHSVLFYHNIIWFAIILDVVDVVIALFVIISICCVKNRKIMKIYYFYSICVIGAITYVIVYISTMNLVALLICLCIFVVVLVMQEYLNQLLKREAVKLERSEQFRI